MDITIGARVRARGLHWDVMSLDRQGSQCLLHLRCVSGDMSDLEWTILHPAESVELVHDEFDLSKPGSLNAWRLLHIASLLDQIPGPTVLSATQPGRVRIEPYQLVPMLRALELPRPRLLLADGVGLGKTIQAGLIATELVARRRAHRIIVICPAGGLIAQWQQELGQRFGLRFVTITDAASLTAERRRLEFGGNPFSVLGHCLLSLDFAKQESVLEELERVAWDLAIIDEAHHCVDRGESGEATQRRRLAEVIARKSDGLLLLTATPHDGYDPHFASLIELLDPSLVDGKGGLIGRGYRRHVIRRLKSHIRDPETGRPLFRSRKIRPITISEIHDSTKAFHQALTEVVIPRMNKPDALAFVSLLKRSVSTIAACLSTVRNVLDRYENPSHCESARLRKDRARALRAYRRRGIQFGTLEPEAEADFTRLVEEDLAAELHDGHYTTDALRALLEIGSLAIHNDPKLNSLRTEILAIRAQYPSANILIFTEYLDSLTAAVRALTDIGEVLSISGMSESEDRARAVERFTSQNGLILLSTDSLAEGLNLHRNCFHLIHLDLPYNPNRLEQRNGRIDRYGQKRDADICYLCLGGTFEERILMRLISKYEKAKSHLHEMPNTLGVTAADDGGLPLVRGLAEQQKSLFSEPEPVIRTLDHAVDQGNPAVWRAMLREIDDAYDGFDRTAVMLGWMSHTGLGASAAELSAATTARGDGELLLGSASLNDLADCPIGRADPEVRKGIVKARYGSSDSRVAIGRYHENAAMLTYLAEIHSAEKVEWSRVIAVRLSKTGRASFVPETQVWMDIQNKAGPSGQSSAWVPKMRCHADAAARQIASRLSTDIVRQITQSIDAEKITLSTWLSTRTSDICGPAATITGDLFGEKLSRPKWSLPAAPIDRLIAFAADSTNAITSRREAEKVIELFLGRLGRINARAAIADPIVRPLGILLLVP